MVKVTTPTCPGLTTVAPLTPATPETVAGRLELIRPEPLDGELRSRGSDVPSRTRPLTGQLRLPLLSSFSVTAVEPLRGTMTTPCESTAGGELVSDVVCAAPVTGVGIVALKLGFW